MRIDPWSNYYGVYTLCLSASVASRDAKEQAKVELLVPARQGGTAWQQLIAQLLVEGSTPANRVEVTKYYASAVRAWRWHQPDSDERND